MSLASARCRLCLVCVEDATGHLAEVHRLGTWSTITYTTYFDPVPKGTIVGDEPLPFEELSQP